MDITGLSIAEFTAWTYSVSENRYGGNVIVHADGHDNTSYKNGTRRCTARLAVRDSHGPGSRVAANGRHGPYACWHAYRDVLKELFRHYPNAVIRSGRSWQVTYRGMDGFLENYPETGTVNVGSRLSPVTMPELCECDGNEPPQRQLYEFPMTLRSRFPVTHDEDDEDGFYINTSTAETRETDELADAIAEMTARYNSDADYVSPAVARASRTVAVSAKLLGEGDKPADPIVFGPEDGPIGTGMW